jgi:hypothetical protein
LSAQCRDATRTRRQLTRTEQNRTEQNSAM